MKQMPEVAVQNMIKSDELCQSLVFKTIIDVRLISTCLDQSKWQLTFCLCLLIIRTRPQIIPMMQTNFFKIMRLIFYR